MCAPFAHVWNWILPLDVVSLSLYLNLRTCVSSLHVLPRRSYTNRDGRLDLLIGDTPILDYYRANDPGCTLRTVDVIEEDNYAVGMTKGLHLQVSSFLFYTLCALRCDAMRCGEDIDVRRERIDNSFHPFVVVFVGTAAACRRAYRR